MRTQESTVDLTEPILVSRTEAARLLGVSEMTVDRYTTKGELKAVKFTKAKQSHIHYEVSAIYAFVKRCADRGLDK